MADNSFTVYRLILSELQHGSKAVFHESKLEALMTMLQRLRQFGAVQSLSDGVFSLVYL